MPRTGKSAQQSDVRIASAGSTSARVRRATSAFKNRAKDSARSFRAINRQLDALQAEYQQRLGQLVGRACLKELNEIRTKGAKLSRRQQERRAIDALNECGVDRTTLRELRRPFLKKAYSIMARDASRPTIKFPHDEPCDSPVVASAPPFGGTYWSFYWERTSNPRDPIIDRYIDSSSGRVGSSIKTSVRDADDYDRVYVEYHTGFNLWHTPQMTGPLEVRLFFDFNDAVFAGKVTDELFWSDITHVQFAEARMRAIDPQNPSQDEDDRLLIEGHSGYLDGEDDQWNDVIASPFESRSYRFKTAATFYQGSPVLLQVGVRHVTWFNTNDESITTNANIDLTLTRVEVHSCPPDIFL